MSGCLRIVKLYLAPGAEEARETSHLCLGYQFCSLGHG